MHHPQLLRFVCLLLILTGCQRTARPLAIDDQDAILIIRTAKTVTGSCLATNKEYRSTVEDYEVEGGPIDIPKVTADRLRTELLNLQFDPQRELKACIPDFRVRFRFQDELHSVDILLCLDCRIMAIYYDSKAYTCKDFDNPASAFLNVVREIFPDSSAILNRL